VIFLLEHYHDSGTLQEPEVDRKLIGWFSTVEKALRARERLRQVEGFSDHPYDFYIRPVELDVDLL
jgi:hypothetical protein